ncbi:Alcohol dehydrogenase [NADP(+)] [Sciurus carolinensis]|uniref:Alcohol dehydrogenase [NADP(+)] n=1 Tax=Sciurus carolinensis TaxID=30640 RepID=A0AA41T5R4_SCICA|nr:Alcohol dehydrogenase [NADP(+)] [Sciurus carolinensis]
MPCELTKMAPGSQPEVVLITSEVREHSGVQNRAQATLGSRCVLAVFSLCTRAKGVMAALFVLLHTGQKMPLIGLGTWKSDPGQGDNLSPKNADGTVHYDSIHYKETWKAMEALVAKGLIRALGLSNFNIRQIDDILSVASVHPAVLQVECHPYLAQSELIAHCLSHGLEVTAYSPLGSSDCAWCHPDESVLLEEPVVLALAKKYGRSPAQILLRWQVQQKVICIPKSITPSRILQNIQVFDFTFSPEEMTQLGTLNKN